MRRSHLACQLLPVFLFGAGCDAITGASQADALVVTAKNVALRIGDTTSLGLAVVAGFTTPRFNQAASAGGAWDASLQATWIVRDPGVAAVSMNGVVSMKSVGVTYAVARLNGLVDSTRLRGVTSTTSDIKFSSIDAGGSHACALSVDGRAFCWGSRWSGETGEGISQKFASVVSPTPVATTERFVKVSVGSLHTCALNAAGHAYCWGDNLFGQLGNSAARVQSLPARVNVGPSLIDVASGAAQTCGVTQSGAIICWGRGHSLTTVNAPPASDSFAMVTAGSEHQCGLTRSGRAFCWGANRSGELGNGTTADAPTPSEVSGQIRFRSLTASSNYSCGVSRDLEPYCWGQGFGGRLGNGTELVALVPTRVATSVRFRHIDAGGTHTCGVADNGTVYCWGHDGLAALGDGAPATPDPKPADYIKLVPVAAISSQTFQSVSASAGDFSCALNVGGVAYCWGSNRNGTLGIGNISWFERIAFSLRHIPTEVMHPPPI